MARDQFGSASTVQVHCPDCGTYYLTQTAEAILKNLKATEFQQEQIDVLRDWIKQNPKEKITDEVLISTKYNLI
jgi:hypothetical protein